MELILPAHIQRKKTRDMMTFDSGHRTIDAAGNQMGRPLGNAFRTADGRTVDSTGAFLVGALERLDLTLHEPLAAVTWQRDIFTDVGGGWVDGTSHFFTDYGNSDMTQLGLIGTATTEISRIQGEINKVVYPVVNWEVTSDIKYIDLEKSKGYRLGWGLSIYQDRFGEAPPDLPEPKRVQAIVPWEV